MSDTQLFFSNLSWSRGFPEYEEEGNRITAENDVQASKMDYIKRFYKDNLVSNLIIKKAEFNTFHPNNDESK